MAVKKKTAKPAPRISEKAVTELAELLEGRHRPSEQLGPYVDALRDPKGLAIAEAALRRVKKGLRRHYLATRVAEAKGDAAGAAKLANEFCRAFGAIERSRLRLGAAFCLAAPLANDAEAVHAGLRALTGADAYYHSMLPIAAANAEARGDAADAARWREWAAISTRLRPTITELRRNQESQSQKKAIAAVDAMPADDRRWMVRRVVWRPELFESDLVARFVLETLDDDEVPAAAWMCALGQVGSDRKNSEISKALRARIKASPAALERLVARVLEADRTDGGAVEGEDPDDHPLYKGMYTAFVALREHAGDPRVYAVIEHAIRSDDRLVLQHALLETYLHGLHCGPHAWAAMTDAQARECFRWLVAAARKGPHEREAGHALFYWSRAGVEDLVEEALETDTNEEVVDNLYSVAYHINAKELLVRRIPREKEAFWRLQNAIGEIWSRDWHAQILDQLDTWAEPRLAEIYLEALLDHVKKLGPLTDLLRRVLAWPAPKGDQARYLKRILTEGTKCAIDARAYDIAREAWTKALAIKASALSNEHITERKAKAVPDPFADKDAKAKLTKFLSGALEKAEAEAKKKVDTARATGKPRKVSDDTLSALANVDVALRVFDHPVTRETLFVDPEGGYHFYDGYGIDVVPWPLDPRSDLPRALANETRCDERALAWDKAGKAFREIVRWGNVVMVLWGRNNDRDLGGFLVCFGDADEAHAFYEKVHAAPPEGFSFGSPHHLTGKGGIQRQFAAASGGPRQHGELRSSQFAKENDDEEDDDDSSMRIAVLGNRWTKFDKRFGSPAEAERAYDAWELDHYKSGARLFNLEWRDRLKRDEDLLLHEWLDDRARDDGRAIGWHVEALPEFERVLRAQGLWPDGAEISIAPGAASEDIEVFAADVEVVPEPLRELWDVTGGASWKLGAKHQRVLGPRETLVHRPKLHAWVDRDAPKWGSRRQPLEQRFRECEVIAIDQDDLPLMVAHCKKHAGDNQFTNVEPGAKSPNTYSTDSLRWHFCTTFTGDFIHALTSAEPLLFALKYGEPAPARRKTVTLKSGDKVWSGVLDEDAATVIMIAGKERGSRRVSRKPHKDAASAKKTFDAAVKAKRAEGFR